MNLDLINNVIGDMKNSKIVQNFMNELQNYLEKSINIQKEDMSLNNFSLDENKLTTMFRDKMYIERANILNNYAKQTLDRGEMYFIYDRNSKMTDGYNLCICEEGKSHTIIEKNKNELPDGAQIGSVLRKIGDEFMLDENATDDISHKIDDMKEQLLKEQTEYLESKRIEGHIYEMSENDGERAWLFDTTIGNNNGIEAVEEIDFPEELLKDGVEGELYVYEDGEYKKMTNY